MVTLGELFAWLLVALAIAWLWRGHGVRERALWFAQQHCKAEQVQLLDGNVAFKGWRIIADVRGKKRLARLYGFEFTVTSRERLQGTVAMFGRYLGRIELQAHPEQDSLSEAVVHTQSPQTAEATEKPSNVVELAHWQKRNKDSESS